MSGLKTKDLILYFNTRDELIRVKLSRVAFFEADANYCNIVFINGAKATILTSLTNIETLLSEQYKGSIPVFIRIGKKIIVNSRFIFKINVQKQKITLTDYVSPNILEVSVSKESLKNLKNLYTGRN